MQTDKGAMEAWGEDAQPCWNAAAQGSSALPPRDALLGTQAASTPTALLSSRLHRQMKGNSFLTTRDWERPFKRSSGWVQIEAQNQHHLQSIPIK